MDFSLLFRLLIDSNCCRSPSVVLPPSILYARPAASSYSFSGPPKSGSNCNWDVSLTTSTRIDSRGQAGLQETHLKDASVKGVCVYPEILSETRQVPHFISKRLWGHFRGKACVRTPSFDLKQVAYQRGLVLFLADFAPGQRQWDESESDGRKFSRGRHPGGNCRGHSIHQQTRGAGHDSKEVGYRRRRLVISVVRYLNLSVSPFLWQGHRRRGHAFIHADADPGVRSSHARHARKGSRSDGVRCH